MSLLVLCPTRSRPQNAVESLASFQRTHDLYNTSLVFVVDEDDPARDAYLEVLPARSVEINESVGSMVIALNAAATLHAALGVYDTIGFVGDDHRFVTRGWDRVLSETLDKAGGGFAYANDTNWQHGEIPTQVFMSASIINELGWMGLPACRHLYVDNAWRTLAEGVGRFFYHPEVIISHLHPAFDKAQWDDQYRRLNSDAMYAHDRQAYQHWLQTEAEADIARVAKALGCSIPVASSS